MTEALLAAVGMALGILIILVTADLLLRRQGANPPTILFPPHDHPDAADLAARLRQMEMQLIGLQGLLAVQGQQLLRINSILDAQNAAWQVLLHRGPVGPSPTIHVGTVGTGGGAVAIGGGGVDDNRT